MEQAKDYQGAKLFNQHILLVKTKNCMCKVVFLMSLVVDKIDKGPILLILKLGISTILED